MREKVLLTSQIYSDIPISLSCSSQPPKLLEAFLTTPATLLSPESLFCGLLSIFGLIQLYVPSFMYFFWTVVYSLVGHISFLIFRGLLEHEFSYGSGSKKG